MTISDIGRPRGVERVLEVIFFGGIRMATKDRYRKHIASPIAWVFLFFITNAAFAETKVFVEEYTYQASDADSKLSSRAIAIEQAKRLLLEKVGTYLESETEVKNFQLTKDCDCYLNCWHSQYRDY